MHSSDRHPGSRVEGEELPETARGRNHTCANVTLADADTDEVAGGVQGMTASLGPTDTRLRLMLAAVLLVGLALRVAFLARPVADLVGTFMLDDAFYCFVIAGDVGLGLAAPRTGLVRSEGLRPDRLRKNVPFAGHHRAIMAAMKITSSPLRLVAFQEPRGPSSTLDSR